MPISEWNDLFSHVERTYVQVAQLLRDVDGLMAREGLHVADGKGSAIGGQGSSSLDNPAWWFHGWVSRFYFPAEGVIPKPLFHVGVLLHARAGDQMQGLPEPVVTAGRWVLTDPKVSRQYWMAKSWAWGPSLPAYGAVVDRPISGHGVHALGRVFAVPLIFTAGLPRPHPAGRAGPASSGPFARSNR